VHLKTVLKQTWRCAWVIEHICEGDRAHIETVTKHARREGSGGELRHLAGSPGGGGGIRSCHTLVRVNTV